jgi:hypothetical protein
MRTVEVLFVIIILIGALIITIQFAVLPPPYQVFGTNLRELSQSTLETLDIKGMLTETIFADPDDPAWGNLKKALSASLPPNVVYNLSVYDISTGSAGVIDYHLANSISDAEFGVDSEAASLLVTSPNVTFTITPEKVGEKTGENNTLYILNCNDANGWWIVGYSAQTLALDLHNLLSPYFQTTVLVNSTYQLGQLLNGTSLLTGEDSEKVEDAVVINTFGESVPIPSGYYTTVGYDPDATYKYAKYAWYLGQRTYQYNWTWVSIVGYPFYYVTNTAYFENDHNGWGIYGMKMIYQGGVNAFLQGLSNQAYTYNDASIIGKPGVVYLSSEALDLCNYYGVYPAPYQTSDRALHSSILSTYNLVATEIFDRSLPPNQEYIPAATYRHSGGGALTAIGLTRTPDIRVSVLALLMYYRPAVYRSEFGASCTSRVVVLQLGQQGGT